MGAAQVSTTSDRMRYAFRLTGQAWLRMIEPSDALLSPRASRFWAIAEKRQEPSAFSASEVCNPSSADGGFASRSLREQSNRAIWGQESPPLPVETRQAIDGLLGSGP